MSPPPLPPRLARGSLPPLPAEPGLGKLRHGGRQRGDSRTRPGRADLLMGSGAAGSCLHLAHPRGFIRVRGLQIELART